MMKLDNLSFKYGDKLVLSNINYHFESGKIYAIVGKSGVGKTTLLSLMSGLADPTEGRVLFNGEDFKYKDKYKFRAVEVGMVFQSFNLLNNLTALENVVLAMDISGIKESENKKKEIAKDSLRNVGLEDEDINRKILKLSGGQQQRVAIARVLATDAQMIMADEPTGNLDGETEEEILKLLRDFANKDKCVVIVTHSEKVANIADFIYRLS